MPIPSTSINAPFHALGCAPERMKDCSENGRLRGKLKLALFDFRFRISYSQLWIRELERETENRKLGTKRRSQALPMRKLLP
jgi:hypothetical protein